VLVGSLMSRVVLDIQGLVHGTGFFGVVVLYL
jgi:hypothetical protein